MSRIKVGLPIAEEDPLLIKNVARQWFESLDIKSSTLSLYRKTWDQWWARWESLSPASITPAMIRARFSESSAGSKTKKNALSVLNKVLAHCDTNPNPAAAVKLPRARKQYVERYQPDELEMLLARLEGDVFVYFSILAGCGLRPGECLALKAQDYDGQALSITKQVTDYKLVPYTKTNVRRRVYVPQDLRPIIESNPNMALGGFMFCKPGGDYYRSASKHFNPAWRQAHLDCGLEPRRSYTLRHTKAAQLLSMNVPPAMAAAQLGHSVAMFLNLYSEFMPAWSHEDASILEPRF